jgi:transcriptional regulator of heat shock response
MLGSSSVVEGEPLDGSLSDSQSIAQMMPLTGHARVRQVLEALSESTGLLALFWDREANLGLMVRGLSRLLGQPEFNDSSRLVPLMTMIEEQDALIRMLESDLDAADMSVLIGLETSGMLANYTLLARRSVGQTAIIGLLGPTRMEYRRALTALDSVAQLNLGLMRV